MTVLARFDRPLEDPSLVWRSWDVHTYVPYRPPAVGTSETLRAADLGKMLE
jgi:hypothetical protein